MSDPAPMIAPIANPDAKAAFCAAPGSASWRAALVAAAARRDFPSLLFAEKWIRALSKAGMYPRWWGDDKGE